MDGADGLHVLGKGQDREAILVQVKAVDIEEIVEGLAVAKARQGDSLGIGPPAGVAALAYVAKQGDVLVIGDGHRLHVCGIGDIGGVPKPARTQENGQHQSQSSRTAGDGVMLHHAPEVADEDPAEEGGGHHKGCDEQGGEDHRTECALGGSLHLQHQRGHTEAVGDGDGMGQDGVDGGLARVLGGTAAVGKACEEGQHRHEDEQEDHTHRRQGGQIGPCHLQQEALAVAFGGGGGL